MTRKRFTPLLLRFALLVILISAVVTLLVKSTASRPREVIPTLLYLPTRTPTTPPTMSERMFAAPAANPALVALLAIHQLRLGYDAAADAALVQAVELLRGDTPVFIDHNVPPQTPISYENTAVSPDGLRRVTGITGGVAISDELIGRDLHTVMLETNDMVQSIAFTSDSRRFAVGLWSRNVWLIYTKSGNLVSAHPLVNIPGQIIDMRFNAEGTKLAILNTTAPIFFESSQGLGILYPIYLNLVDVTSGAVIRRVRLLPNVLLSSATFSDDGQHIIAISEYYRRYTWDVSLENVIVEACALIGRDLTDSERHLFGINDSTAACP